MKRVLLIDDDVDLCALMSDFFAQHEFVVDSVHDGPRGLARALDGGYDLVVLDVMLPVLEGFELLKQLRRRSSVPVIMLTARTAQKDRISGLDAGADDYLPKPFGPEELLARMRAVLRRTVQAPVASQVVAAGDVRVNSVTREVSVGSQPVEVTAIEFDILDFLVRSAGRVVSRNELAAVLYQRESTPYERALDVHISHLRKKIEFGERSYIRTVRGVGYLFSPLGEASR
ncbi:MAG: response regulator transcription factor [Bryobacteraceae bacterium]